MNGAEVKPYTDFALPFNVVSKIDVSHLVAEAERVDNALTTAAVRAQTGAEEQSAPVMSEQLASFLEQNQLDFGNTSQRSDIIKQLRLLKDNAPVIHLTFAVEADRESLQQLAQWLRESVHPQAIVAVGLQPGLVAGVYVRTPNRVHDLSLRNAIKGGRGLLSKELGALRGAN